MSESASQQQAIILRAIAASSTASSFFSAQDREQAFRVLQDLKSYPGRIPIVLDWISAEKHFFEQHDITTATKLLGLEILSSFLQKDYNAISENSSDRLQLRAGLLKAAALIARSPMDSENRILAKKLAALIEGLVLREFPQRWTTFFADVFSPQSSNNGFWYDEPGDGARQNLGVRMCLEILKLTAEDCTDSDFNSKISTQRRNDVLLGFNEISDQILPLLFQILEHYPFLQQTQERLHTMHKYLISSNRNVKDLNPDEATQYQVEYKRREDTAQMMVDCLITLESFCFSMPVDWFISGKIDFMGALLYLLREPEGGINVRAVSCIEQLIVRGKFELSHWLRILSEIPKAVNEANTSFTKTQEYRIAEQQAHMEPYDLDPIASQLEFHKAVSRLLSVGIASNLTLLTNSKTILQKEGEQYQTFYMYLKTLVDFLKHPSGTVASEQINMWVLLLRDPQITKTHLLHPFAADILRSYMEHLVRIRWEDVEDEKHPKHALLSAAFDDEDDFEVWQSDLRSKASLFFKLMGHVEPLTSCQIISERIKSLLSTYGSGESRDHLSASGQLTPQSDAVLLLEALIQPLDTILNGMPSWTLNEKSDPPHELMMTASDTRLGCQRSLEDLAACISSWNPKDLWLRFRRAQLLEAMKNFWKKCSTESASSTLLQTIDSLLKYLALPDEWENRSLTSSDTSPETVGLKKKSGVALVSISKLVPARLVPWLAQLSNATSSLLSSEGLIPTNQMHLYEFLTCVATAIEDHTSRSKFIGDVLSSSIATLLSPENQQRVLSPESILALIGADQALKDPQNLTNPAFVDQKEAEYNQLFASLNRLLSVGKRCNEASRKTMLVGGVSMEYFQSRLCPGGNVMEEFPDEVALTLEQLSHGDPFSLLWPRFLPTLLTAYNSVLGIWVPERQGILLNDTYQKYVLALSDDEAFLSKNHDSKSVGGVFGEGGTAGSIISGVNRRDKNLVPKWSGWLNELRNTCFQLLGLLCASRVVFAPEISPLYPEIVGALTKTENLKGMEHRHFVQFVKHVLEIIMICTPATLYKSHLAMILGPMFDHIRYRLELSWGPVVSGEQSSAISTKGKTALSSSETQSAAQLALNKGENWYHWYYSHSGLFVGDLDSITAEAAVEKYRVDVTRAVLDALQVALGLKGDWSLVLANKARAEQPPAKKDDSKFLNANRLVPPKVEMNADGTPKSEYSQAADARKLGRINGLCHFLLLEDERIAGNLVTTIVGCLRYPDAYTCRRTTKICHRILETVAWVPQYSQILGEQMLIQAVRNIVTEPKWMVGIEWDMINVARDIYCRLVLGQTLQFGGQGAAQQQNMSQSNPGTYEQAKSVNDPLQGGGILVVPSDFPRRVLMSLPGIQSSDVQLFESRMKEKRSAKDQKECIKDLLVVAAAKIKESVPNAGNHSHSDAFDRAVEGESLLMSSKTPLVPALPEKLITRSQLERRQTPEEQPEGPSGLYAFNL